MRKIRKYLVFALVGLLSCSFLFVKGQYINNGILISIEKDGLMTIKDGDFINNGFIQNTGTLFSNQNIINNDTFEGRSDNSVFEIQGDWHNNRVFIPGKSTFNFSGDNQLITGDTSTRFYNLNINGNGPKTLTKDIYVENILDLSNTELATNENTLYVTNPDINAISRSNGFISSIGNGRLVRKMNSNKTYLFPTGSSNGVNRYRPVEITPKSSQSNSFGIRLANVPPTQDNLDLIDETICAINPDYYHKIYRLEGNNPVDLKINYDKQTDNVWSFISHWENNTKWTKMDGNYNYENNSLEILNWNDFNSNNFILARAKPELELGDDIVAESNKIIQLHADYKGATIDNIFWSPSQSLSCDNCLDPEAFPVMSTSYKLRIEDIHGCSVEDSILIVITDHNFYIPNAFSPNGDGLNDYFTPMAGYMFENMSLMVFNRWGEKIFETKNPEEGWDGTSRGEKLPMGSYFYSIKFKTVRDHYKILSGIVTLL